MAVNFPDSPVINQSFTAGGNTWYWTGVYWRLMPVSVVWGMIPGNISNQTDLINLISAGNTNIYNTNGTLTGNRVVTMGSNTLTFLGTGAIFSQGRIQVGDSTYTNADTFAVVPTATQATILLGKLQGSGGTAPSFRFLGSYTNLNNNTAYFQIGNYSDDSTPHFRITQMYSTTGLIKSIILGASTTYAEGKLSVGVTVGAYPSATTPPTHELEVTGTSRISVRLLLGYTTTNTDSYTLDVNGNIRNVSGNNFLNFTSGNTYIGYNSDPSIAYKLTVNGTFGVIGNSVLSGTTQPLTIIGTNADKAAILLSNEIGSAGSIRLSDYYTAKTGGVPGFEIYGTNASGSFNNIPAISIFSTDVRIGGVLTSQTFKGIGSNSLLSFSNSSYVYINSIGGGTAGINKGGVFTQLNAFIYKIGLSNSTLPAKVTAVFGHTDDLLNRYFYYDGYSQFGTDLSGLPVSPTALVDILGSSVTRAGLRIRSGTAPTVPNSGDLWSDGTDLFVYLNGTQKNITSPTAGLTGSGTAGQITYWSGTSAVTGSSTYTFSPAPNAVSGLAVSLNLTPTLTATANNDLLTAIDLQPTFTNGAFTGVTNYAIRATGQILIRRTGGNATEGFSMQYITDNTLGGTYQSKFISLAPGVAYRDLVFVSRATLFQIDGYRNGLLISNNGNVVINSLTDGGQRLQVIGDAFIQGSGNTNATTALTVQNSDGINLLRVRNDLNISINYIRFGNSFSTSPYVFPYSSNEGTPDVSGTNLSYYNYTGSNSSTAGAFTFTGNPFNQTSGNQIFLRTVNSFTPTSGTATLDIFRISWTINQTGGANGITRGLYINPTLTAAADFRAIETTAGNVLFGSNFFWDNTNGRLGIGTSSPNKELHLQKDKDADGVDVLIQNTNTGTNNGTQSRIRLIVGTNISNGQGVTFGLTASGSPSFSGNAFFWNERNTSFMFATNNSEKMRLWNTGNLTLTTGSFTDGGQRLQVIGSMRVGTTAASAMYWDDTNNRLGIGVTNPTTTLDVNGTITTSGLFLTSTYFVTGYFSSIQLNNNTTFKTESDFYWSTPYNTPVVKMRLFSGGNLMLQNGGTFTDNGQRLQVMGDTSIVSATSTGITTTTNVHSFAVANIKAVHYNYYIQNTVNGGLRTGVVMAVTNGTTVEFTDTSTNDLTATTAGLTWSVSIVSTNIVLTATITSGTWNIKVGTKML